MDIVLENLLTHTTEGLYIQPNYFVNIAPTIGSELMTDNKSNCFELPWYFLFKQNFMNTLIFYLFTL